MEQNANITAEQMIENIVENMKVSCTEYLTPETRLDIIMSSQIQVSDIRTTANNKIKGVTDSCTSAGKVFAEYAIAIFETARDAGIALEMARTIAPRYKTAKGKSTTPAEKAASKRAERRQDNVIRWLKKAYETYEFYKDNGTLAMKWIGDADQQEARLLAGHLQRLNDIGFLSISTNDDDYDIESVLLEQIRTSKTVTTAITASTSVLNAIDLSTESPLQTKERAKLVLEKEKLNNENMILMEEIARLQAERNANTAAAAAAADQNTTNQAARQKVKRAASIS
jgi:hypothetical protein